MVKPVNEQPSTHTDYPRDQTDRQMPEVGHGPGPPPPRARESDRTARSLRFTRHFTFSGPLLSESENAAIWTALLSAARPPVLCFNTGCLQRLRGTSKEWRKEPAEKEQVRNESTLFA